MGWNAWAALAEREHIEFDRSHLPDGVDGFYARHGERAAIGLSTRLTQVERHAVLTHELVHDEWGPPVHCDPVVRAREERRVDLEVAARLVPVTGLAEFCDRMADLGIGVGPQEVVDEYDVPRWVAEAALDNLTAHERGNR